MIQITSTVFFDETKPIQEQSPEFQQWFSENCLINDQTPVTKYDEYNRPNQYDFSVDETLMGTIHVTVFPRYIYPDPSNWAISGYTISIPRTENPF
jgi:hypothetical protein